MNKKNKKNKKTLLEYLINYGWSEDIASEICVAYREGMASVKKCARFISGREDDYYVDEIVENIRDWKKS